MRILIFEQWHSGHYYHYVRHLLPPLIDLVDEVVVAVTPYGRESVEFASLLAPFGDRVRFDAEVGPCDPRMGVRERLLRLHHNLRRAVRRIRPDYVLVPSGDGQTSAMGLYRAAGLGGLPGGVRGEAGILYALGPAAVTWKDHVKDAVYELTWRASSWERLHFNNMLVYEWLKGRGGDLGRRARLLANPVPPNPRIDRSEARRRLGLPEDGRYLGLTAVLDRRKAIPELLAAFREGAPRADDRLLLAGPLDPSFRSLIGDSYEDLVKADRLFVLDRFIDIETADVVTRALDVVCTPYPRFGHVSSTLLHGVAAGRPVLAHDFGWPREMVRRFRFGWLCDVLDPEVFRRTLRGAFEQAETYRESEATRRLLAFHAPENYAELFLDGLRDRLGRPAARPPHSWEWVLEALDDEGRESVAASMRRRRTAGMP